MKILVVVLLLVLAGCCRNGASHVEPSYPTEELGWKNFDSEIDGVLLQGRFVLHKGEAADNGKLRIKVLELIPPNRCAEGGAFDAQARVRFQFIRLSDQQVLCEDVFPEHGGGFITPCRDRVAELGVSSIGIRSINLKEGWVFFGCSYFRS